MNILPYTGYVIDNTDLKRQHPCSLMISHLNCPHIIVVPNTYNHLQLYLTHPTCKFMNNTFSNDKCYFTVEHFTGIFVNYNYPENLYENLLEMWDDFDTLNRRCITKYKCGFESSYNLCKDICISATGVEKNWKRQYSIHFYDRTPIALGSMDEMIAFIEVNYPECINPLQFIKPARI